jgi:hypothetical protein
MFTATFGGVEAKNESKIQGISKWSRFQKCISNKPYKTETHSTHHWIEKGSKFRSPVVIKAVCTQHEHHV